LQNRIEYCIFLNTLEFLLEEIALKYNDDQRREYLIMTDEIGHTWVQIFEGNTEFYSAAYWDLLTSMWRNNKSVRKTDALGFMKAIKSAHTAGKYIESALSYGFLIEMDNPDDARSKLLVLSDDMRLKLDSFFDNAVSEVRKANREIDIKGPSPEDL
jgi:hypothetical protein